MKILLIEDEPRAARRLYKMVDEAVPDSILLGPIESVSQGREMLKDHPDLDLIVSDIQLSDGLSFDLLEGNNVSCPVIFTTAFDQYAIKAFKVNGIDYLLKPIDKDELQKALDKACGLKAEKSQTPNLSQLANQLAAMTSQVNYKQRFMIKVGQKIKTIGVEEVLAIFSEDKTNQILVDGGRSYVIDYSMEELALVLNPNLFFRINRGAFANHSGIVEISTHSNSRLRLVIRGAEQRVIIVARERVSQFKEWLDR